MQNNLKVDDVEMAVPTPKSKTMMSLLSFPPLSDAAEIKSRRTATKIDETTLNRLVRNYRLRNIELEGVVDSAIMASHFILYLSSEGYSAVTDHLPFPSELPGENKFNE